MLNEFGVMENIKAQTRLTKVTRMQFCDLKMFDDYVTAVIL